MLQIVLCSFIIDRNDNNKKEYFIFVSVQIFTTNAKNKTKV